MTALLEAKGLKRFYKVGSGRRRGTLHALDGVDIAIGRGESVGLVGESGCGKSTLARVLARLVEPSAGSLVFEGEDIGAIPLARFVTNPARPRIQMVFQDPTESLNPHLTVADAIADPLRRLARLSGAALDRRVREAIDMVGLPEALLGRYPHQLSGGQKARVGIARAIAVGPELLILDEPTSALDVSVQAVVLKLLADLRDRLGMSYVFVSHDLDVVRLLCERVVVMYLGEVIETAPAETLFERPAHPYTRALIAAIPHPERRGKHPPRLDGSPRSPIDPDPNICQFYGRCPIGQPVCAEKRPPLRPVGEGHLAACHFAGQPSSTTAT
ncbi:MAG TPA: ABC transporter ATP-binding protein [Kaistia sp.]|nr:ABC transporter ATP-binding protein [Kaistia sp.]